MRAAIVVVLVVASAALSGCVFHGRSQGHTTGVASVEVGLDYTYFPTYEAYYCESSGAWWVIDGDAWVSMSVRPPRIVITDDTPWVMVNVEGSHPQARHDDHARDYPSNWQGNGRKGPPPGRGWRK